MSHSPEPDPTPDWRQQLEAMTPVLLAWSHVRLRGRPSADAEDLTQEILCRAMLRIDTFVEGNFQAWVFAIGKLVLLEHHRQRRRSNHIRLAEGDSGAQAALDQVANAMTTLTRKVAKREGLTALLELVADLDEQDRTLAVLCGMEGQGAKAAAVQIGITEEAAKKRWQRLCKRLKGSAAWLAN